MSEAVNAVPDEPAPRQKRRIEIHTASEGRELSSDVMSVDLAPEVLERLAKYKTSGQENGYFVKLLFGSEESGVSLTYAWFKSNYRLSPHSHNSDCTYYVVSGEAHLGARVLRAGDVFFVPADVPYAYNAGAEGVEVLEFRSAAHFNVRFRTSSEAAMKRSASVVAENSEHWLHQEPPIAARRMLDPTL